ncbi:MAG: hypothetical protein WD036_07400 [Bauldia sp.]
MLFADRLLVVGILIRAWGPQIYADWAVLLSCAGLLALGELGLNVYCGNVWQRAHAKNDADGFQRMVSVALGCSLALAGLLGAIGVVVLLWVDVPALLSVTMLSPGESIAVLCLVGAAQISRLAKGAISQIYRGRGVFARGVVIDQAFVASLAAATVGAALLGANAVVLAAVYLACDLVAGWGLMTIDLRRRWPDLSLRPRLPRRGELHDMWRHMRWLAVLHGASVTWVQVPVIVLGVLPTAGSALVGFLVLRTLANLTRQLANFLAISTGVEIAMIHFAGRGKDVVRQLSEVGRVLSAVAAALVVSVALFGEPFVTLWTGQPGLYDVRVAVPLFGAVLVVAPALPLLTFAMYGNSFAPVGIAGLVQLAVGLGAVVLLASRYGAPGAAVGLAIGEVVGYGVVLPILTSRQAGLRYLSYLGRCAAAAVPAALWCATVGLVMRLAIDPHSPTGLLASGLLWGAFGLVPALAVLMPAERRAAIARRLWSQSDAAAAISKP